VTARLALLVLALVFAAPSASAKEGPPPTIEVCGPHGCADVSADSWNPAFGFLLQPTTVRPVSAYYTIAEPELGATAFWLPAAGAVRQIRGAVTWWSTVDAASAARLAEATAGLEPYTLPADVRATVAGRAVPDASGYLRLFEIGSPAPSWPRATRRLSIRIVTQPASPWGDCKDTVFVSRTGGLLLRDHELVRIPVTLARRLRARLPLDEQ
jgi:hypothetical protein